MKTLLVLVMLTVQNANAFTLLLNQKLPQTILYDCDTQLEPRFLEAINLWNKALDGHFTIRAAAPLEQATITVRAVSGFGQLNVIGLTSLYGSSALIQVMTTNFNLSGTLLHETGHALGLNHTTDVHAIMFKALLSGGANLDQDDMDGVRFIYGLSPKFISFFSYKQRGRRVLFRATSNSQWDFGDGTTQYGSIIKHRYVRGIYIVAATNGGFCQVESILIKH